MKLDQLTKSILKSILTLACITLFLIFLIKAKVVIIYILISMVLTLIFSPFSSFLKSKLKFNNLFSSIASLLTSSCYNYGINRVIYTTNY